MVNGSYTPPDFSLITITNIALIQSHIIPSRALTTSYRENAIALSRNVATVICGVVIYTYIHILVFKKIHTVSKLLNYKLPVLLCVQ